MTGNTQTYDCEICHGVNHVARLHCHTCGTIPRQYSILRRPAVMNVVITGRKSFEQYTPINVANGCERQVMRRTIKRIARTVPMDYYAEGRD